jgi:hypothetical protein
MRGALLFIAIESQVKMSRYSPVLLCLLLVGCDETPEPSHRLVTIPVKGIVRMDGKPLANARIVLHPVDERAGIPRPVGTSDANGAFELRTYSASDGAPEGDYRATISCRGPFQGKEEDRDELAPELVPSRYTSVHSSGITVSVSGSSVELKPWDLRR